MSEVIVKSEELTALLEMAEEYGVRHNALFLSCVNTYCTQKRAIEKINSAMDDNDITVEKQYVKNGSKNQYLHPAIKDLPKHADALNRTTAQLLNIIDKLGRKQPAENKFQNFRQR